MSDTTIPVKSRMQEGFAEIADHAIAQGRGNEMVTVWFDGERSDFVRFNHARVRQPGHVEQRELTVRLIDGKRHTSARVSLTGDAAEDRAQIDTVVVELRDKLQYLPEDPHLLVATEPWTSNDPGDGSVVDAAEICDAVLAHGAGDDVVGILAAGPVSSGFASSTGQRNWFERETFQLDVSLYLEGDKAVKTGLAGAAFDADELAATLAKARTELAVLARPKRTLERGNYRSYLTPTALEEILGLLSWGGFSCKAHQTKQTPLRKLADGSRQLHPSVHLSENTADGAGPAFNQAGFARPGKVPLIEHGKHAETLVSPRSAREYGIETNGADDWEIPTALDLAGGDLDADRALEELGTGVWLGNTWYTNYSERANCRVTGMTRFATFWVEHGELVAPIEAMRFDVSLYDMLGDDLVDLTRQRTFKIDADTYERRSTSSSRLPGALVNDFSFTL